MSGTTGRDSTGKALMWSVKTPTFVCATLCLISDTVNEIDVDFLDPIPDFLGSVEEVCH